MNNGSVRRTSTRLTQFFLLFVGSVVMVTLVATRFHTPKVHADVKAVETFECDPDTDSVVFFSGPISLAGSSCTAAMVTLSQNHFDMNKSKGPEAINREHLFGGTDSGPGHDYYLMIFWED